MKTIFVAAAAIALIAMAGSGMAAETNTLTVTASVAGTCKFFSTTSALGFGSLDPSSGGNVPGSGITTFWCTKGVSTEAVSAGNGLNWSGSSRRMIGPGGDLIPYSLTLTKDGLSNGGPAVTRTLSIDGLVSGTDYTGKAAGSYSDTVTITLTY